VHVRHGASVGPAERRRHDVRPHRDEWEQREEQQDGPARRRHRVGLGGVKVQGLGFRVWGLGLRA